jgi:hypothetical protein
MGKNPRYDGRPLLRLLELYVLWAIGELSEADAERLRAITPNLRRTYGAEGEWQTVLATELELPPDLPGKIHGVWEKNVESAKARGVTLNPQQFAEQFVDHHWKID